jgi:hypothetical protein
MFNFLRDSGEKRTFEYESEYAVGRSGKVRRACPSAVGEEARMVLAEALYATAEQLERDAGELRRRGKAIVEAEAFGAMVGG